jgi:hypothetical protein
MGLFLSHKQVFGEMEQESLRASIDIFPELQDCGENAPFNLRPFQTPTSSSLMHLTISIPCWVLYSLETLDAIFEALVPILDLHLSSLKIQRYNIEDHSYLEIRASFDALGKYLFTTALGRTATTLRSMTSAPPAKIWSENI